jgi:hypothetical protein
LQLSERAKEGYRTLRQDGQHWLRFKLSIAQTKDRSITASENLLSLSAGSKYIYARETNHQKKTTMALNILTFK